MVAEEEVAVKVQVVSGLDVMVALKEVKVAQILMVEEVEDDMVVKVTVAAVVI